MIPSRIPINPIKIVNSSIIGIKPGIESIIFSEFKFGFKRRVNSKLNGKNFIISSASFSFQCAAIREAVIIPTMIIVKIS